MKTFHKLLFLALCCCAAFIGCSVDSSTDRNTNQPTNALDSTLTPILQIEEYFANQNSDVSVIVKGTVTRILNDDTTGDRHQRFIIRLSNDQTILITHNIDIALRVAGIAVGSIVYVHGDYGWNSQGGFIHWTHHDPDGLHENGWIVFKGVKYE